MSLLFEGLLTEFRHVCLNFRLTSRPVTSFKEIESLIFSSKYSPTNIVRVETLNRKERNIYLIKDKFIVSFSVRMQTALNW